MESSTFVIEDDDAPGHPTVTDICMLINLITNRYRGCGMYLVAVSNINKFLCVFLYDIPRLLFPFTYYSIVLLTPEPESIL